MKFFYFILFFLCAQPSSSMNDLEKSFGYINFDYDVLDTSIKRVFPNEPSEFFSILTDITDSKQRQAAREMLLNRADIHTRGAALRIMAALKRWEEENSK